MDSQRKIEQKLKHMHVPRIEMRRRHQKMRQALMLALENKKQTSNIGLNLEIMKLKFIAPVAVVALVAVVFVSGLMPGFGNVTPQAKAQAILNDAKAAVAQAPEDVRQDLAKIFRNDNLMQLLDEAYNSKSLEYIGAITVDVSGDAKAKSDALLKAVLQEVDKVSNFSPVADYNQTLVALKGDIDNSIDFSQVRLLGYTNHDNLAVVLAMNKDDLPVFRVILMQNKSADTL